MGALVATLALFVPSSLLFAAVGMNISTGIKSARRCATNLLPIAIAVAVFVAVGLLRWPMLLVVATLAPLSIGLVWTARRG